MSASRTLKELVALSNNLGKPERDYVILSEGNTSARADAGSFWVKRSGTHLRTVAAEDFVRVSFSRVLEIVEGPPLDEAHARAALAAAALSRDGGKGPSIETFFHALFLNLDGVRFVGHTHPVAVNSLTCSAAFPHILRGRIYPEEVIPWPAPLIVPCALPGPSLARNIKAGITKYMQEHGVAPKVAYLQNHGLVVAGATPQGVEEGTAMAVKIARVLLGTLAAGGPHFIPPVTSGRRKAK